MQTNRKQKPGHQSSLRWSDHTDRVLRNLPDTAKAPEETGTVGTQSILGRQEVNDL